MVVFISHRDTNLNLIAVKLGDFGIAKFQTDGTDTYVGSREFLAPVSLYRTRRSPAAIDMPRSNDMQAIIRGRRASKAISTPWEVSRALSNLFHKPLTGYESYHEEGHKGRCTVRHDCLIK